MTTILFSLCTKVFDRREVLFSYVREALTKLSMKSASIPCKNSKITLYTCTIINERDKDSEEINENLASLVPRIKGDKCYSASFNHFTSWDIQENGEHENDFLDLISIYIIILIQRSNDGEGISSLYRQGFQRTASDDVEF